MGRDPLNKYIRQELNKFLKNPSTDPWEKGRASGLLEVKKLLDKEEKGEYNNI